VEVVVAKQDAPRPQPYQGDDQRLAMADAAGGGELGDGIVDPQDQEDLEQVRPEQGAQEAEGGAEGEEGPRVGTGLPSLPGSG
jgi:hypothetical protein